LLVVGHRRVSAVVKARSATRLYCVAALQQCYRCHSELRSLAHDAIQ